MTVQDVTRAEMWMNDIPHELVGMNMTRWWFQIIYFLFSSLPGEGFHFDYFSKGLKPPTR